LHQYSVAQMHLWCVVLVIILGASTVGGECGDAACQATQRRTNRLRAVQHDRFQQMKQAALLAVKPRAWPSSSQPELERDGSDGGDEQTRLSGDLSSYAAHDRPVRRQDANHTHTTLFLHISKSGGTSVSTRRPRLPLAPSGEGR
jgi:hypothetical protein